MLGAVAVVFLVIAVAGGATLRTRRRRAADARRRDEHDFDLVFPEGPDDRPVRKTTVGRRIARH